MEDSTRSDAISDDRLTMQSAVLHWVLDVHPNALTVEELIREMAGEEPDFGTRDEIRNAMDDLRGVGLLHLNADFVSPTRAAQRFALLE